MKFSLLVTFVIGIVCSHQGSAQKRYSVAFYNVENLFDTQDDPHVNDNEFLPKGVKFWNQERYNAKLLRIADVLSTLGDEDGPEFIGLCEIENRGVLEDLIKTEKLKGRGYAIVHYESPDPRGIDVAFLYKASVFKVKMSKTYMVQTSDQEGKGSRDILLVHGTVAKQPVTFLINHWPSRVGGQSKSEGKRILAAEIARRAVDSIQLQVKNGTVFLMGDLNDDPTDSSVLHVLGAAAGNWVNPALQVWDTASRGTLEYRGKWNWFDQILYIHDISNNILKVDPQSFSEFAPSFMRDKSSKNLGRPFRTYEGKKYTGGYSDHFPVYLHLYVNK
jgi:predicted extracellular nuclease